MHARFRFADAVWFTVPLRVVAVGLGAFAILSLYPALLHGSADDRQRALFGLTVLGAFLAMASLVAVAVNDSYVAVEDGVVRVRFEAFFAAAFPVADIASARPVEPPRRWRYGFGLSTDFAERVSCSHGGPLVEIQLVHPCEVHIWPRTIHARRLWLGVREHEAFLRALRRSRPDAPPALAEAA